jgi:ketosteroid isomerase-like protein
VLEVVDDGALRDTAVERARRIARHSPVATRMGKAVLNRIETMDLQSGYEYEQVHTAEISGHPDSKEALVASIEGRQPVYGKEPVLSERQLQKATVVRFYRDGMNRRDVDAMADMMDEGIRWYSLDSDMQRVWYVGREDVRRFLAAMVDNTAAFRFDLAQLVADPDTPDLVIAEWANEATMADGSHYANVGATAFAFMPTTTTITEIRQYFDTGPLAARAEWRAGVREVAHERA